MARRSSRIVLSAEQKKLQRRIKREARKEAVLKGMITTKAESILDKDPHYQAQFWSGIRSKSNANKVLNSHRDRPYWASLPVDGSLPFSGFFPCNMIRKGNRWYFGFLFREHRDAFYEAEEDARKELTGCVRW